MNLCICINIYPNSVVLYVPKCICMLCERYMWEALDTEREELPAFHKAENSVFCCPALRD